MRNILKIIRVAKPLYPLISFIALLILITALLEQVAPILSKYIIDEIVAKIQGSESSLNKLFTLIAISFIVNLIGIALGSITERSGDHFAGRLQQYLTEKFYNKVLTLSQSYFDTELSGKIINQLNRGIASIQGFANTSTNFILPTFLQSIFTIGILAYYNLPTAIFTFSLFPIYLILTHYSTKKWGEEEGKKNVLQDITRGRIQEVISNIKVVKGFNNELNEYNFISNKQTEINQIYAKQSRGFHIFDFMRNLSLQIILLLINIVVFYGAYQGSLTIGEMALIIQLVLQARRPLFAMSFILTQIQAAEHGSKEFFEILELKSVETMAIGQKYEKIKKPELEFRDVVFEYESSKNVLDAMSFKINAHEKVALVGHSGAGKSTIINLILKFYNPTSGKILISGQDYAQLDPQFIRNNISLVFQENELFSTTIRDNVAYGSDSSEAEIITALKKANAYDFVMGFKNGIDTEVGERGVRLSGGQKQRIQIARAILHDRPILILDEATSNLDSQSERYVQDAMENLMQDKLVIIIAHRLSTIQNVDRILVIDTGKVVAAGSPQTLAKEKGIYSTLLKYQIEGNKKLLKNFEIY